LLSRPAAKPPDDAFARRRLAARFACTSHPVATVTQRGEGGHGGLRERLRSVVRVEKIEHAIPNGDGMHESFPHPLSRERSEHSPIDAAFRRPAAEGSSRGRRAREDGVDFGRYQDAVEALIHSFAVAAEARHHAPADHEERYRAGVEARDTEGEATDSIAVPRGFELRFQRGDVDRALDRLGLAIVRLPAAHFGNLLSFRLSGRRLGRSSGSQRFVVGFRGDLLPALVERGKRLLVDELLTVVQRCHAERLSPGRRGRFLGAFGDSLRGLATVASAGSRGTEIDVAGIAGDPVIVLHERGDADLRQHVGLDAKPRGEGDFVHLVRIPGIQHRQVESPLFQGERQDPEALDQGLRHSGERLVARSLEPLRGRDGNPEMLGEMLLQLVDPQVTELDQIGPETPPEDHL